MHQQNELQVDFEEINKLCLIVAWWSLNFFLIQQKYISIFLPIFSILKRWRYKAVRDYGDATPPIIFLNVSGGGSKSSYWTMHVLQQLHAEFGDNFMRHTVLMTGASGGMMGILTTVSVFAVLCFITYICFIFRSTILSVISKSGLSIITRLMGLILAVIGTQMVIIGITTLIDTMS